MKKLFSFLFIAGCMTAPTQLFAQKVDVGGQGSVEVKGEAGQDKVDVQQDVEANADVSANAATDGVQGKDHKDADVRAIADINANQRKSIRGQADVQPQADLQGSVNGSQQNIEGSLQSEINRSSNDTNIQGSVDVQGQAGQSGVMMDANGRVINNGNQWNNGTTLNSGTQWNTTGNQWQSANGQVYQMDSNSSLQYGNSYSSNGNMGYRSSYGTVMPASWSTGNTYYQPSSNICYQQPVRARRGLFRRFR